MQVATLTPSPRVTEPGDSLTPQQLQTEQHIELLETVLTGILSLGIAYDLKFVHLLSPKKFLLEIPETLDPESYYGWVLEVFQESEIEEVEGWHLDRAIRIDRVTGRLDLCLQVLEYGIDKMRLNGLQPQMEKLEWLLNTNYKLLERGLAGIDLPLKRLFAWGFDKVALYLKEQILMGASPQPLLMLLISRPEIFGQVHDVGSLLELPWAKEDAEWKSDEFRLEFLKACLIAVASLPISAALVSRLVGLITEFGLVCDALDSLTVNHGDVGYLRELSRIDGAQPLVHFLSQQVGGWELLEKYEIPLPRLDKCLKSFLVGAPSQHHRWLQTLVRSVCPKLEDLESVSMFWEDVQHLGFLGHFGSLAADQLLEALIEGLLSCDAYELVSQLTYQDMPIDIGALESMALAASQERFTNLTHLDSSSILECSAPLAITEETPDIAKWRAFVDGAHELIKACAADRVSPLPMPVEIHLEPQTQLYRALLHPRCKLYKDMDRCYEIARLLGVSDHPIYALAVSAAVQRGDFSSAYVTCLSLMQSDPDDAAFDVCLELARNAGFRDLDKRLRLVSIALSTCPPSQFNQWLTCYRELEATIDSPSLPSEAHELFSNSSFDETAFRTIFKDRPAHRRPNLSSHPMYASEVSSMGDDFYDGTLLPSMVEQDFRLLCMAADCRMDSTVLTTPFAFSKWRALIEASDPHLFQLHLVHVPDDKRQTVLGDVFDSPKTALQAAYIHCLVLLPQLFESRSSFDPVPNFLLIQPAQVLMALESSDILGSCKADTRQLAEKAYHAAGEMNHLDRLATVLIGLDIDPVYFHAQGPDDKLSLLQAKAATLNFEEFDLVLRATEMAHCDVSSIRLANLAHVLVDFDESFWSKSVDPFLYTIDPQCLHDQLLETYSQLDGTHVGSLRQFFKSLIEINSVLEHSHPAPQLQIRKMLLDDWAELLGAGEFVDFKAIMAHLISGNMSELRLLLAPLLEDPDSLSVQVPQLLTLVALFKEEHDSTKPTESELTSLIYLWALEQRIDTLKANFGLVMVDDIGEYARGSFPNLTEQDLLALLEKLCGPEGADAVPLETAQCLLRTGLEFSTGPDFLARLVPIEKRLQMLQNLSDLADPATEEDLGFSTIKLIESATSAQALFLQLLKERISPWLLENLAPLLSTESPTNVEALSYLIRSGSVESVDILAGFGAQLNLYSGPLADWAEAQRFDIKEMILEEILPDSGIKAELRQEVLVALYNIYGMDSDDGIRVLLEWRCNLLLHQAHLTIEALLNQSSASMPQVLLVLSRYFQFLNSCDGISSEVSISWMRIFSELASDPSTSPSFIHQLWIYLNGSLDAQVLKEHTPPFLKVLLVYHPLAYYRIGLGLPDSNSFDLVVKEFLTASHYDLGTNDDPIIYALLLARGKAPLLALSCPDLFKEEAIPLLASELAYPALQQYVLRNLLMDTDPELHFLAEALASELRYHFAPKFLPARPQDLPTRLLQPTYPKIPPALVPTYDGTTIPSIDELSELLLSLPLPEFPNESMPYIQLGLSLFLPHQK